MKISKSQLKRIIKEELEGVLAEMDLQSFADSKNMTVDQIKEKAKMIGISVEELIKRFLQRKPTKRGLAGLKGAKPLRHVKKSVVVTGTKG